MDSDIYQITIKSANQKVDDYVTYCKSYWTVETLKKHISETHVNKPNVEDQRLIYAGNLLKDTLTLKQIFFRESLCTELTNSNMADFTIHLVCSQNSQKSSPSSSSATKERQPSSVSGNQSSGGNNIPISSDTARVLPNLPNVQSNTEARVNGNTSDASATAAESSSAQTRANRDNHVSDIVNGMMQSEYIRQQFVVFQQLADLVAVEIAQNLVHTANEMQPAASEIGVQTDDASANQTNQNVPHVTTESNIIPTSPSAMFNLGIDDQIIATNVAQTLNRFQTMINDESLTQASAQSVPDRIFIRHRMNSNHNGAGVTLQDQIRGTNLVINGIRYQISGIGEHQHVVSGNTNERQLNIDAQRQAAQAQPVVEQPAPMAAVQVGDPEGQAIQHDVIDWAYYSVRAIFLMAALYVHASLTRLAFLAGFLALIYFLRGRSAGARAAQQRRRRDQIGGAAPNNVGPDRNALANRDRNEEGPGQGNLNQQASQHGSELRRRIPAGAEDQSEERAQPEGDVTNVNNTATDRDGDRPVEDVAERRLPFLKLCYLVITEFLASLIPNPLE